MDAAEIQAIHDAATVILYRDTADGPAVLMGQRAAGAAFMPSKFVFPGGRVDAADADVTPDPGVGPACHARLGVLAAPEAANRLAAAAIREVWEETGLILGRPDAGAPALAVPPDWQGFFASGHLPDASALRFFFRAVTPPGRPRRFDARFFLAPATALAGDADDLSRAGAELAHLRWLPLAQARALDLPFITEIVLAEVERDLRDPDPARPVPFFDHSGESARFLRL